MKLQKRIVLQNVVGILVVGAVSLGTALWSVKNGLQNQLQQDMARLSSLVQRDFESLRREALVTARFLAANPDLLRAVEANDTPGCKNSPAKPSSARAFQL